MATVDPAMMSSEERPVGLRTRSDLTIQESVFQGEYCWIVKDPLAMKYFRLRKPEYLVFKRLYEPVSYQELKVLLTQAFPEVTTRLEAVQQLVVSLHRNGLLISNSTGQAAPLKKRYNKELQQKLIGLMSSLVSLRFPGWDPERFLSWLHPKLKWLFTKAFAGFVAIVCLSALMLILTNFDTFMAKLPDFQRFFNVENLFFMAAIMIFTKTIHELGHGLMCKHFGGECHQIGFMLLVMTPAMYCDTSDSWVLRNRWHRMAIGAAGMYFELFMASICTFIWWFTHPGWIHYIALNIMFLSSTSTVIFNANPLLRYDGYYILSDFLEIPNLAQKGKLSLVSRLRVWCLGMKPVNSRLLPTQNQTTFALYSVAAFCYRWFVMIMIFWFISEIFRPYGLEAIGHIMIAISLFGMIGVPLYKLTKFFLYPGRLREVKKRKFYVSTALVMLVITLICYLPVPHYVWATFVVRPQNAQMLLLTQSGSLDQVLVGEGEVVRAGTEIATLSNTDLTLELEELRGQYARLNLFIQELESMSSTSFGAASQIAETEAQRSSVEKRIKLKEEQIAQLTVKASRDGKLFAPPNVPKKSTGETELETWTETPLSPKNRGCYLEANALVGMIGDPERMEAILVVNQSDVKLLEPGQKVIALLQQFRNDFVETKVTFVSQNELEVVPRELSQTNKGPIPVKPDLSGVEKPIIKSYEVRAEFDPGILSRDGIGLLPGMRGHAKIRVGSSSLGSRLLRFLNTTIKFR